METIRYHQVVTLYPENNAQLLSLCGQCNEHLHLIEQSLHVHIKQRGYSFSITGTPEAVEKTIALLQLIYRDARYQPSFQLSQIHLFLQSCKNSTIESYMEIRIHKGNIVARGENQVRYIKSIMQNDINFGIGPAGTGKTYLAVASAVNALETERVSRIILVRPIVEAGEKLGFLPGDLAQKVHPYLRPLYDALYEMLGFEKVHQLIAQDVIELVPLAYMRGRSLNDSFIILDEGQNTTLEQMKMFLTRIGFNSKAVITGDITQIDLVNRNDSGLIQVIDVLKDIKGISFIRFQPSDVVRHPLVQSIVEAYEKFFQSKGKL